MNLSATGKANLSQWLARNRAIRPYVEMYSDSSLAVMVDFEFSRLPLPGENNAQWLSRVELVSIGMAPAGDLPTFYAATPITPRLTKLCAAWTRENVLPLIERRPVDYWWRSDSDFQMQVVRYLVCLEERVKKPLLMVADWPGDLLLLIQQLGKLAPRACVTDIHRDALWPGDLERARAGLIQHNALDDAIWLRRVLGLAPATSGQAVAA